MLNFFKTLLPSGETKEVDAIETWVVSWQKRTGQFHGDVRMCYQAFTNEKDAIALKEALKNAHKLIGNTNGTDVRIEKQKAGL